MFLGKMPIYIPRKGINKRYRKMGINITETSYSFENRESLRNTAREILSRQNSSNESNQNILNKTIFDADSSVYSNAQLAILKASSQISINGTLKETLRYLKNNPVKKVHKEAVLGELWNLFTNNTNTEFSDITDWEIDYSAENIFAAA